MHKNLNFLTYALFSLLLTTQFTSCSKDSDLLSDYVLNEKLAEFSNLVVDDSFSVAQGQTAVLDVLRNDQFADLGNVTIISTTSPKNGTVTINEDNTLTYMPKEDTSEGELETTEEETDSDTFNYTAEETNDEGETTTEDGTVTIDQEESKTDESVVNFKAFGAKGDGKTDDTKAIQNALNAEPNLIADANSTFKITSQLDIDAVSKQIIDWNNSTIVADARMNPCIKISKLTSNGGTTTMSNLIMDGNDLAIRGIYSDTRVVFNNVSVKDLNQGSQGSSSAAGFFFKVKDDADSMGDWIMNDCSVTNLVGASIGSSTNCVVASNVDGSVNGVLFYWDVAPTIETVLTWNNLNVDGMWGDDGGGVFINNASGLKNTTSKHIFNGGSIKNCERRALKGFSSNMEFNNMTFESPISTNPNIQCGTISGMVVFGADDRENIHFDNCDFIGTSYESRVIPIGVTNWSIKNSRFTNGADIAFTKNIGEGKIENCTFENNSVIYEYGATFNTKLLIDSNNKAAEDYIKLDANTYTFF
jgi:hypothetical protein